MPSFVRFKSCVNSRLGCRVSQNLELLKVFVVDLSKSHDAIFVKTQYYFIKRAKALLLYQGRYYCIIYRD